MLQVNIESRRGALYCLNPFEVREVLQDLNIGLVTNDNKPLRLNPFEVREVLQGAGS